MKILDNGIVRDMTAEEEAAEFLSSLEAPEPDAYKSGVTCPVTPAG